MNFSQSALLVVDVQVGVMKNAWNSAEVIRNIGWVVDTSRTLGIPVFWVQHADHDLKTGSNEWKLVPTLTPLPNETKIYKQFNSAFENTSLEQNLKDLSISQIIVCGAATNWCIRSTVFAAIERGYDLILIQDAHSTVDAQLAEGHRIPAEHIVSEFNSTLGWLSYPNRTISVKPSRALFP